MSIFEFKDYRAYIETRLKSDEFGRGGKAKLAEHLSCQPSFVSQVLKGKSSFSLEQGFKLNAFFKHNLLEKEFLMILIELDRAGTADLRSYFDSKREELVEKSKLIENQMSYDQLSEADTIAYYNNWNCILIRNLLDIPSLRTVKALKQKLKISESEFLEAFDFLREKGLIHEQENGELRQGHMRLHVKKKSPLAKYANITARLQMIKNYEKANSNSLNYGHYMTLPKKSFAIFKQRFVDLIVDLNSHLDEQTEPEMMAALIVDFMEI